MQCSVIFITIVLSYFLIAIVLNHSYLIHRSVIPHWYSIQSFFTATMLSHSHGTVPVLQRGWEAAQSRVALVREMAHSSIAGAPGSVGQLDHWVQVMNSDDIYVYTHTHAIQVDSLVHHLDQTADQPTKPEACARPNTTKNMLIHNDLILS
jgi:hypothetical protein